MIEADQEIEKYEISSLTYYEEVAVAYVGRYQDYFK